MTESPGPTRPGPVGSVAVLPLTEGAVVSLAGEERSRALIGEADEYTRRLGPVELPLKLGRTQPATPADYLELARGQVREWSAEEVDGMAGVVARVSAAIGRSGVSLELPPIVEVVKSTLAEEGYMHGYTRRRFIVMRDTSLSTVLFAHELFHVLSRYHRPTREALYAVLGARLCPHVELPEPLFERRLTNPDAPFNETLLTVEHDGETLTVAPVLLAEGDYDGPPLSRYLRTRLLVVETDGDSHRVRRRDGAPLLLVPDKVESLFDQVGRNTTDVHPEEVSAEHFVMMLARRADLPRPDLVQGMWEVLTGRRDAPAWPPLPASCGG